MGLLQWADESYPDDLLDDIPEDDSVLTPQEREARAGVRASSASVSSVPTDNTEEDTPEGVGQARRAWMGGGRDGPARQAPPRGPRAARLGRTPSGVKLTSLALLCPLGLTPETPWW
jgi:hypothetical protein